MIVYLLTIDELLTVSFFFRLGARRLNIFDKETRLKQTGSTGREWISSHICLICRNSSSNFILSLCLYDKWCFIFVLRFLLAASGPVRFHRSLWLFYASSQICV